MITGTADTGRAMDAIGYPDRWGRRPLPVAVGDQAAFVAQDHRLHPVAQPELAGSGRRGS